jgi:N-methylhydantoinase A
VTVNARIGIDIGGTFTDLVLVDDRSGAAIIDKILTVPGDPGEAVETGIMRLLEASGPATARSSS